MAEHAAVAEAVEERPQGQRGASTGRSAATSTSRGAGAAAGIRARIAAGRAAVVDLLRERPAGSTPSWHVWVVLLLVPTCLTLLEYLGSSNRTPLDVREAIVAAGQQLRRASWLPELLLPFARLLNARLVGLAWWALSCVLYYFVIPAAVARYALGLRLRDLGLRLDGFVRHLPIYGVLFLLVLPAVILASQGASFQRAYPFYRLAHRSAVDLLAWELLYGLQFFSLEFFFRGFLLHSLRPRLGAYAILVMVVPYCMIHFGKPMPEALGAIFAGVVLGVLAMTTRSIWSGVLIHLSVAWSMDLLALAQKGLLGKLLG